MKPLWLRAFAATSCLGRGRTALEGALQAGRSGLIPCDFEGVRLPTYIGRVDEGSLGTAPPAALARFDSRQARLAEQALTSDGLFEAVQAARERHGPRRVGLFIGTSTAGILETERAYRRRAAHGGALPPELDYAGTHNCFGLIDYLRRRLALEGPAAAVSGACAASAKAFASAQRLIEARVIDAALVGGVDSLCFTTLRGFSSLQLCAPQPCRPFDRERNGISVAEAAAFALLERAPASLDADAVLVLGIGESSDAYHMSAPHPQGNGAEHAMRAALLSAALPPEAIDYINLHGTGTVSNDSAEGQAVVRLFGSQVPCSSTKGATGHTLGAAGALEAVICALCLQSGLMPGGVHTREIDASIPLHYLMRSRAGSLRRVISNAFGFGGMNCSIVLGRAA
jgi:3-oxoacyl-[acyl-carrier-protein] synthase-1